MAAAILRVLVLLALGATGAAAESYPALFRVVGVASDDVLNVRTGPGGSNPVIDGLAHDATGVEVIRTEGSWGLVNTAERTGWASLRFMERQEASAVPFTDMLSCFGTEPFWSLDITPGATARLSTPSSETPELFQIGGFERAWNPLEKYVLRGGEAARPISVLVVPAYCDDGMSDREYGLDVTVFLAGSDGPLLSGCCSLAE
jgi:uncharacterized membrane protein